MPQTDRAFSADVKVAEPVGAASTALVTLLVPVAQRKYRIRAQGTRYSVIMTRANSSGGVDISRAHHPSLPVAIDCVVSNLLQHFQHDFDPVMNRFDGDYHVWLSGKPGIRPRSSMWRKHVEDIGNHLCRLGEAYAQTYRDLHTAALTLGCDVPVSIPNHWLEGAQESIDRGLAGKHMRLEELVRKTTAP